MLAVPAPASVASRTPAPCRAQQGLPVLPQRSHKHRQPFRGSRVVAASTADEEAELEKRLERLRAAKGASPTKAKQERTQQQAKEVKTEKPVYDFTDEKLYYEGGPHVGDLAINVALGTTLVWLPLTLAAVGRAVFVKYRFTDKRFSVQSTAPWRNEQTDVAYQEVKEVRSVGRGLGLWGDMVVVLSNGDKVEMRSLDRFKELEKYILERRDALGPAPSSGNSARPRGKELTAAELMGEVEEAKSKPKGFA